MLDLAVEGELDDALNFKIAACINGQTVPLHHGTGAHWPDGSSEVYVDHYALARARPWTFHRFAFPWPTGRKPQIKSLGLALTAYPADLPGTRFTAAVGDAVTLIHPRTGTAHTLTVEALTHETLDTARWQNSAFEMPSRFVELTYTLTPDLPRTAFAVRDTAPHDAPRPITPPPMGEVGDGAVGLIVSLKDDGARHKAASSLHFAAPQTVEWLAVFREKPAEDLEISLI